MEYDLTRLGTNTFEEMCRALFQKQLGPAVTQFGNGPDGGREATYRGTIDRIVGPDGAPWEGLTILQAKFRQRPLGTAQDQRWLIGHVRKELQAWANPRKKRRAEGVVPDYLVIATNVVLSPATGGGIDTLKEVLSQLGPDAGIRGWFVWRHDQICSMLDDAQDIRSCYAGLITSGDVLSQLVSYIQGSAAKIGDDLRLHTAQSLVQDRFVRLTESGGLGRLTLEQVGVDLPALRPTANGWSDPVPVIAQLVAFGDHVLRHHVPNPGVPSKVVLVGGPGQGKTTLSHFLAQTYRAALLGDDPDRHGPQVAPVVRGTLELLESQKIPRPRNKRWPIRINLASIAEQSGGAPGGLLSQIAGIVRQSTASQIGPADIKSWLQQWPWLLILDGFDEVASAGSRRSIQQEVVNLFIEADAMGSDLMTVITTRPQGYENDFAIAGGRAHGPQATELRRSPRLRRPVREPALWPRHEPTGQGAPAGHRSHQGSSDVAADGFAAAGHDHDPAAGGKGASAARPISPL